MSTPPFLPLIDLANFAPLPADQKRRALEGFKQGRPPYSYQPVRQSTADLMNIATSLFGFGPRPSFEQIATVIRGASKYEAEAVANLNVAAGLYELSWQGRRERFRALGTTIGQSLVYWEPVVVSVDGHPVVPFFNQRRTGLGPEARRFVFSAMHEQIRVAEPDFTNVRLCICQFADTKKGPRSARLNFDDAVALFSFEDVQAMVAETYAIWAEVWAGRVEEARRSGGKPGGLL